MTTMVAAVECAKAHVPVRSTVTTFEVVEPLVVPVQVPVKPLANETVGDAGTVNDDGRVTLTLSPVTSAPLDVEVKPAVQFVIW